MGGGGGRPASRQRRWQLVRKLRGLCQNCGKALKGRSLCPSCLVKHRVRERTRRGCKERAAPRGAG